MTTVNMFWLIDLLHPLTALGEDEQEVLRYRTFDPDNNEQVRELIRRHFLPHFQTWDRDSQEAAKTSLAWFLTFQPQTLGRVLSGSLLPFPTPDSPELFWQRIWQELFRPKDFHLQGDPDSFEVEDDPEAPRLMRVRNRKPAD